MLPALLVLFACSDAPAPVSPGPNAPPSSREQGKPGPDGPGPGPGQRSVAGPPIPPGATAMPENLVCKPPRGAWGCFHHAAGGRFEVGAQSTDPDAAGYDAHAAANEGPVHEVELSPYWIQAQPTTATDYDRCVQAGACPRDGVLTDPPFATLGRKDGGNFPIVGATWEAANTYCAWLGGRLPTEAEWEAAARGAEGRTFAWGEAPACPSEPEPPVVVPSAPPTSIHGKVMETCAPLLDGIARQLEASELDGAARFLASTPPAEAIALCKQIVELPYERRAKETRRSMGLRATVQAVPCTRGELPMLGDVRAVSPEGLSGLGGLVWEWTQDWFGPYAAGRQTDPTGPASGTERVQRGGSYLGEPWSWRAALRAGMVPDAKLPDVGFRCVWTGDRR